MDLELGLKITKTRDDIASISEYRLAKAGPVFQSKETNTMFILTAHLKGYKRNNINIKISEDGSKISISGEKPVQNILMMGWLMHRKEVDVAGFNKVFKIPDGVKLDGIKAKHDEEEQTLNIFMPKLVKGICGDRIEEIKEESELEKSENSGVGETSQRGSKESEVQAMEDSESFTEKNEGGVSNKMIDDSNREIIKEKIQKEVEESKLGNGESSGEKGGVEGYEVMKISELEQNVGGGTSHKIGDTSQKDIEESELRIEDGGVKGMREEEVGNTTYEAVKTTEKEKSVGEGMIEEFKVQEMEDSGDFVEKEEKVVTEKMIDDANGNIIGEVIQKERKESKSGIEDRDGENTRKTGYKAMETSANVTQNIGDTSQRVSKESVIEQMGGDKSTAEKIQRENSGEMLVEANVSTKGESKHKQFGELKPETEERLKETSMELMETTNVPKNVDHIPSNIGSTSQKEKIGSIEENMDEGESERMVVEANKDTEKVKQAKVKRKGKEIDYFLDDGKGEEPKRMVMEAEKGLTTKSIQETEDVTEVMVKRKDKKIENLVDRGEGEEPSKMHLETNKDLKKETMQEREDVREAMVKREGIEIEGFAGKGEGEEHQRMVETKKDLAKETMQECEDVKETLDKRKGKEIEYFLDKGEGEEPKMVHMKAKKDPTTETMHQTGDVKEVVVKRRDKEIEDFVDKCESKESKGMHMEAKKDSKNVAMQESEKNKELMVKTKGKETEYFVDNGEQPKMMHMEAKKDLTADITQESEDVKQAVVSRKGKEVMDSFLDDGVEPKKDLTKVLMQESEEVKEAMIKRKDKETGYFADESESKEPKRMHMKANKEVKTETIQESEDVKEAMVEREGKEIDHFLDEGEGEEPNRMLMEAKKDLTTETMQESKDFKEATVKRKAKEIECFVDQDEGKKPKRIHMEVKKDLTNETRQESEYVNDARIKRKGKEIDYFVDKGESEELERTHVEAKKDMTKNTMQEEIEKIKNGTKDSDQQDVLGKIVKAKFEVPTEELPKLVKGKDGSRGHEVANMEEQKDMTKEAMVEIESLKEKVKGEKPKKTKEVDRVIQKNAATEILQKEAEESNIEKKSRCGPYVPENMVKVVFELLGTFEAKLPKQVMKATAQNKMDKNEYVIVKLKGEGSMKMQIEPNETFDEDEIEKRIEKEIRKPKLKSSDQVSGKENVDVGVFDGSKRPKFLEIGEINDVKEDNAKVKELVKMDEAKVAKKELVKQRSEEKKTDVKERGAEIEQFVKKVKGEKYEKIQVQAKEGLKKDIAVRKDQQYLQEGTSKGRYEASTARRKFPMQIVKEGGKAKTSIESQKGDPTKDMKNLNEMMDEESKQGKTLKPEIPLEKHLKKGEPITIKDEFAKGQKDMETMQKETEGHKDKIVDSDQQHGQRDVAINVNDEKPRIQEEKIKSDVEKVDKKEYQTKAAEENEGMLKGEHKAKLVHEIKRERPKVAKNEEAKEASKLPLKRELGKTTQTTEEKKPKIREITPVFEKAKEPHELSLPRKDYKIPKIEEVQQKKKGKRHIHAPEATTSREEEELARATATHSKAKSEIDELQVNKLPSPSIEMRSKEPCELEKHGIKEHDSKAESLVHMQEGKEYIHSIEGTTTSEVAVDEAVEPSKLSSSSSTQPFKVEGKDKIGASCDEESLDSDKDSEISGQESTKDETDEEVEQRKTLQPESPEDQKCINKDQEESHETHEIEEEKVYEQLDKADVEDSELLEEQKECEEEATEGKKKDQKLSKKLFVSMIIAGSALVASGIFLFIRHRRTRKG